MKIQDYLLGNRASKIVYTSGIYEVRLSEKESKHNLLDGAWSVLTPLVTDIDDIQSNEIYIRTPKDRISFIYSGKVVIQ